MIRPGQNDSFNLNLQCYLVCLPTIFRVIHPRRERGYRPWGLNIGCLYNSELRSRYKPTLLRFGPRYAA